ncbi:hypothetical protein NUU61_009602 [Penicillium alfredii]|uniref:Uncharacterized protein n=1 Tax=Penicillium alfredii TaxID=1506179 RepID=A0A9W9EGE3_9EURO|nr:uncharacterized protein NUU61_009602 [Penicillium alfredii]KAJ5081338.1 hypothetical protein NUU61_009602 [Penicillium alfredii]
MKAVVAHHLGFRSPDGCHIAKIEDWFRGSFNVCIPISIDPWKGQQQPGHRVFLRFPLPYRVGEKFRPRNGDENIQCEAGAPYAVGYYNGFACRRLRITSAIRIKTSLLWMV